MSKMLRRIWKCEYGFSLVEALVTIVIVGAAMIPISMVFTQTIRTTTDTRKQLQANELAQEYLEVTRSIDMSAFNSLFSDGITDVMTRDSSNGADEAKLTAAGYSSLPEGYKAIISYTTDIDISAFTFTSPQKGAVHSDAIVYIDSGSNSEIRVVDTDNQGNSTTIRSTGTLTRNILVDVYRTSNQMQITYNNGANDIGQLTVNLDYILPELPSVRFIMGDIVGSESQINTTIKVNSNLPDEFKVYVYESNENTVNASTEVLGGYVSFSRNLSTIETTPRRIVEIYISIIDTTSGEEIARMTTTKIDE